MLLLFLIVFSGWTLVRLLVPINNGWEEILIKPIIFLLPTWFVLRSKSLITFLSEVGFKRKDLTEAILWGVGAAIALIIFNELIRHFTHNKSLNWLSLTVFSWPFLFNLLVSICTAINEEIVFRGVFFRKLFTNQNNLFFALSFSTIAFVVLHIPRAIFILKFSPANLAIYLYLLLFLSVINTLLIWKTKNLTTSIVTHTLWNFYSSLL